MLSRADIELVRRDPALQGLATLLDPDAFRLALATAAPERRVEAVEPLYVRYKPGTSCLVAYRLSGAGSDRRAYATTYAPRSAAKLDKARAWSAEVVVLDTTAAAAVRFFPHDRRLPGLRRIADAAERRLLLRKLVPDRPRLWDAEPRELSYKPERRWVTRLDAGDEQALLKVFAGPDFVRARTAARAYPLSETARVARVIGRSRSKRIVVLEWLEGTPLQELARTEGAAPFKRVGAALAELHERDASGLPAASPQGALAAAADALSAVCPALAERAETLAAALAEEISRLTTETVALHGDFSADQVVLSDTAVGLLDLDNAARGDPAADLGSFAAQLERDALAGTLPAGHAREAFAELVEGYRADGGHRVPSRALELHTAASLLRLAAEPFRYREPAWDERAAGLLEQAERVARFGPHRHVKRGGGGRSLLERLARLPAEAGGHELRRAWPRRPGHLLLEYAGPSGSAIGAQWLADGAKLDRIARATPRPDGSMPLVVANGTSVLLHTGGADRRLLGLAPLLAQAGAELVVHRPERRAVVRLTGPAGVRYAKVVRPERVHELAATGAAAYRLADDFEAPELLELDARAGVVIWSALEGESLYALAGRERLLLAARAAGQALRALHDAAPPASVALHGGVDEARWLEVWLERVAAFAPAVHREARAAAGPVLAALAQGPAPIVLLHRDFFDKQVVVDDDGRAGLLDFDTLAAGEAALDVANALVHFELRALQGRCPPERATAAAAAFLDAYEPQPEDRRRLDAYADASRLRLACVYAFRPRSAAVSAALLASIGQPLLGEGPSARTLIAPARVAAPVVP